MKQYSWGQRLKRRHNSLLVVFFIFTFRSFKTNFYPFPTHPTQTEVRAAWFYTLFLSSFPTDKQSIDGVEVPTQ